MKNNILYLVFFSLLMVTAVNAETLTPAQAASDAEQAAKFTADKTFEVRMLAKAAASPNVDEDTKAALEKKAGEAIVAAAIGVQTAHNMLEETKASGNSVHTAAAQEAVEQAKESFAKIPESARSFGGFFKNVLDKAVPIITTVAPIVIQVGKKVAPHVIQGGKQVIQGGWSAYQKQQQQKNRTDKQ